MRPLLLALTLFALPCLATAGALGEQPVQMPAPYRPLGSPGAYSSFKPAAAPERQRPMKHRWGFGLDSIPGASTPSLSSALVQEPNAVTVRWWATDRLGIDVAAAFSSSSVSSGSTASTSGSSFGAGVGFKYNLSEPSKDLLAQLVMKASTASTQQSGGTAQLSTQAVFVGAGFEAFVPGWDWLSLEGSAGASLLSQSIQPTDSSAAGSSAATQSNSTLSLGGSGFSPLNLAIHVYF